MVVLNSLQVRQVQSSYTPSCDDAKFLLSKVLRLRFLWLTVPAVAKFRRSKFLWFKVPMIESSYGLKFLWIKVPMD
jgi:hypothetical protein